jgi:predicted RNA binding protein YcfA (HicA-like mRNA interferase family)
LPQKIRQLKAALAKAGFVQRPAKGSHTYWTHPLLSGVSVTVSGKDGADAKFYQEKQVIDALKRVGGIR